MNKLLLSVPVVGSFLAFAGKTFAAAPVPDASVVASATDVITGLKDAGIAGLVALLPIAGILVVTAALVFWVLGHFRAIARI